MPMRPSRHRFLESSSVFLFLIASLSAADKLAVDKLSLRQFEDGPALAASHEFLPGETIYWSFRVRGYRIHKNEDEESHMKLSWTLRVADPKGILIEKERTGRVEARLFEQDKDWTPRAADSFVIPPLAPAGVYKVTVKLKDEPDGAESSADIEFKVRGDTIQPTDALIAQSVRFLRHENDPQALQAPVYRPGDTLWVRFEITGYKFGEKNKYDVEYGLAVQRGSGETMFSQPVAAKETNESFYPQHFLPGVLSLGLNPDLRAGTYIMVITLRDKIGTQTWETREKFEVR